MTLSDLLAKYEPELAAAFIRAINEINSGAQINQIVTALEKGDVQGAIEAIYIDSAAFQEFERALQQAYLDGGNTTLNGLTLRDNLGQRFIVRFDARNFEAERWLREHSSDLVTRIVEEQKQVIRTVLETGMRQGDNPRTTALDIVGRINRATGLREGGVVGLTVPQEKAVTGAYKALQEGDYQHYLGLTRRDKRFDRTIAKAMRDGAPLTSEQITKIIGRYKSGLLKLRGDTIARTEALTSLHAAQYEALKQLVATGKVNANQVRRVWDATLDKRTRRTHAIADGQSVGLDDDFKVGNSLMRYPGDMRGGPEEVINCRCFCTVRIDYLANIR